MLTAMVLEGLAAMMLDMLYSFLLLPLQAFLVQETIHIREEMRLSLIGLDVPHGQVLQRAYEVMLVK